MNARDDLLHNFYMVKSASSPYYSDGKLRVPSRAEWKAMTPLERGAFNLADQRHANVVDDLFAFNPLPSRRVPGSLTSPRGPSQMGLSPDVAIENMRKNLRKIQDEFRIQDAYLQQRYAEEAALDQERMRLRREKEDRVRKLREERIAKNQARHEASHQRRIDAIDDQIREARRNAQRSQQKPSVSRSVSKPTSVRAPVGGGGGGGGGGGRLGMLGYGLAAAGGLGILGASLYMNRKRKGKKRGR